MPKLTHRGFALITAQFQDSASPVGVRRHIQQTIVPPNRRHAVVLQVILMRMAPLPLPVRGIKADDFRRGHENQLILPFQADNERRGVETLTFLRGKGEGRTLPSDDSSLGIESHDAVLPTSQNQNEDVAVDQWADAVAAFVNPAFEFLNQVMEP